MATDDEPAGNNRDDGELLDHITISARDKKSLQCLLSALTPIGELRERPIPLSFVVVFLSVALKEGQAVGDYAKELGMTRFATFKYIQSIGNHGRHNADGLGLVSVKKGNGAKTAVVLTDKGRAVAGQMLELLHGGRKQHAV